MELDASASGNEHKRVDGDAQLPPKSIKKTDEGSATMDCFQSLSKDLQLVHIVLNQVRRLVSSTRRLKELALAGM